MAAVVWFIVVSVGVLLLLCLQVQYVLSDKTGTLTQNIMGFVWASVGGKLYGQTQHAQQAAQHAAAAAAAAAARQAAARHADSSSKRGSSANLQQQGKQPAVGSGGGAGGVVIDKGADSLPPPNTPHTIALDDSMRAAAKAAADAAGANSDAVGAAAAAAAAAGVGAGDGAAAAAAAESVGEFLLALALCNTVVPTATDAGQLLYQVR
jgi:phospholipid-translocating ATPase/phospholipid-transporting ATPase